MGENKNNENKAIETERKQQDMPTMSMSVDLDFDQENADTQNSANASPIASMGKSVLDSTGYQMIVGKRNASIQRLEEYKVTKPKVAKEIESFVAKFDYKNPMHIERFGAEVTGQSSVKELTEYIKMNRNEEATEEIREMLLEFIDGVQAKPPKKSLLDRLKNWAQTKGEKSKFAKIESAHLEEILEIMEKRTQANLIEISTKTKAEISKFLGMEQKKALQIDMYVIAGELILKKIEEEYLPVLKDEYEKDPTSVEKKLRYKEAEERAIDFLARLNNVITTSSLILINVDTLLKEKEINKETEIFLKNILGQTIPVLTQQCAIKLIDRKNQIPLEEAMKIQQITEQVFVENAKEVSDMYVQTVQQSGKPFISTDVVEEAVSYCKEAIQKADEIKKDKFKIQLETHDRLERLNNEQKIVANELAFRTMTMEELEQLQKTADAFKPQIS